MMKLIISILLVILNLVLVILLISMREDKQVDKSTFFHKYKQARMIE
jgi:hypothetical protein